MQALSLALTGFGFFVGVVGALLISNGRDFGRVVISSGAALMMLGLVVGFISKFAG